MNVDFTVDLLAAAMEVHRNSYKLTFASCLDKCGLLQFRLVRWILSITDERIKAINQLFHDRDNPFFNIQKRDAWIKLCARWKIAPPDDETSRKQKEILDLGRYKFFKPFDEIKGELFKKDDPCKWIDFDKPAQAWQDQIKVCMQKFYQESPQMDDIPRDSMNSFQARTIAMKDHMHDLPEFDDQAGVLEVIGKQYRVVTSDVYQFSDSDMPLISCGSSSSREMILFDPPNSPLLQEHYQNFVKLIDECLQGNPKNKLPPEELIKLTNFYMNVFVFTNRGANVEQDVSDIVQEAVRDDSIPKVKGQPCISIEEFLKRKTGVCRHHSLVAAYLMDRFLRQHPQACSFSGAVQVMRDNIRGGAHAWVTLVSNEGQMFCLDTLNNFMGNLNSTGFKDKLELAFGKKSVEHQLKKGGILREKAFPARV